jgi:hypothetical protein
MEKHVGMKERRATQQRSYWGICLYALSVILALWSVPASLTIFCVVALIYFVPRRIVYSD